MSETAVGEKQGPRLSRMAVLAFLSGPAGLLLIWWKPGDLAGTPLGLFLKVVLLIVLISPVVAIVLGAVAAFRIQGSQGKLKGLGLATMGPAPPHEISLRFVVVEGNHLTGVTFEGSFVKLSTKGAEARLEHPVAPLSNLKMHLSDSNGEEIPGVLYGKVVGTPSESPTIFSVRFTSISPEVEPFLQRLITQSSPGNTV